MIMKRRIFEEVSEIKLWDFRSEIFQGETFSLQPADWQFQGEMLSGRASSTD